MGPLLDRVVSGDELGLVAREMEQFRTRQAHAGVARDQFEIGHAQAGAGLLERESARGKRSRIATRVEGLAEEFAADQARGLPAGHANACAILPLMLTRAA